jgi:hypothetical protein
VLLSGEPVPPPLGGALAANGFERVLAVPVSGPAPAGAAAAGGWRSPGWSLRRHGTDFALLPDRHAAALVPRCYSFGWGLHGDDQRTDVLLAQACGTPDEVADLWRRLRPALAAAGRDVLVTVHDDRGRGWLRCCAVVGPPGR